MISRLPEVAAAELVEVRAELERLELERRVILVRGSGEDLFRHDQAIQRAKNRIADLTTETDPCR